MSSLLLLIVVVCRRWGCRYCCCKCLLLFFTLSTYASSFPSLNSFYFHISFPFSLSLSLWQCWIPRDPSSSYISLISKIKIKNPSLLYSSPTFLLSLEIHFPTFFSLFLSSFLSNSNYFPPRISIRKVNFAEF